MSSPKFSIKRLILLIVFVVPLVAWFVVKPVRVVVPAWSGLACEGTPVCVEVPSQRAEATALYLEANEFVSQRIWPLSGAPRMLFCTSEACASNFGLGQKAAVTLGTFGTVIGPRGWQPHIVRHELIHYLQGQRLGVLRALFKPTWYVEGMAYALSQDPRSPLAEPWESHRRVFNAWNLNIKKENMWREARAL